MGKPFEHLLVWKKARELTRSVYDVTKTNEFSRDLPLRDQMRRAAVSVMSNIAEGYERGSDAELGRFLSIARGSCGEIRSQLYIATDQGYGNRAAFDRVHGLAVEVSRMLRGFTETVKATRQARLSTTD